jgi:tetratricopeptide (TPR) repeat protein
MVYSDRGFRRKRMLWFGPSGRPEGRSCAAMDGASIDLHISACTGIIESSRDISAKALAFMERGDWYTQKAEYDLAVADFNQSIEFNPKSALAFASRGGAYAGKAQYDRAIADLDQAIRLDPKLAQAFMLRGYCNFSKGQYKRAIPDLEQTPRLQPRYPDAITLRNQAQQYLARGGMPDRAEQCSTQCMIASSSCESGNDMATLGSFAIGGFNLKGAMLGSMMHEDCRSQRSCVQCIARR